MFKYEKITTKSDFKIMNSHQAGFKQTEIGMIPEDWEIEKTDRTYEISSGLSKPRNEFGFGHPFLSFKEIFYNFYLPSELGSLVNSTEKERASCSIKRGDVFLTRTSETVGELGMSSVALKNYENATFNGFAKRLRPKFKEKIFPEFAGYLFRSNKIRIQILKFSSLTTRASLTASMIKEIDLIIPPLSEQRAISSILLSLDKKIEFTHHMNKTLDTICQTIFKQWFVDFEFPNEKGRPYKSSGGKMVYNEELEKEIPKGWTVGFLGDGILTKISKPGINKFDNEKTYLDTSSVQNSDIVKLSYKITFNERPSRANMQPKENTIWFAKMKESKKILLFDKYSDFELKNFILSTGFACLDVESFALYYIWSIISNQKFEKEKDSYCNGTTMQAINNENIMKIRIMNPEKTILSKFNNLVKSIFQKSHQNTIESLNLLQVRDLLLPKLISGKIRVTVEVR